MKRLAPVVGGATLVVLLTAAVDGQDARRKGDSSKYAGSYPKFPGALTKAPEGLGSTPFDVTRFFAAPPPDRNAAPIYLDAFFEFGDEMAVCFRDGLDRDRRRQAARDRSQRYLELDKALFENPKAVPATSIDAVISLYNTGFFKLAEAQRRERCVFETGLDLNSPFPHFQAARQVARVSSLRVRRAVERGNFDAAIRDIETLLRLIRDLRPRGSIMAQLVSAAITQVVCQDLNTRVLAAPRLRVEHCDRLLKLLSAHDAGAIDGYSEGLRRNISPPVSQFATSSAISVSLPREWGSSRAIRWQRPFLRH